MRVCSNCGAENSDGSRFCETCGADLGNAAGSGQVQQPAGAAPNPQTAQKPAGAYAGQQQVPPAQVYQGAAPQQKSERKQLLKGALIGIVGLFVVLFFVGLFSGPSYDGTWVCTNYPGIDMKGGYLQMTIDGSDVELSSVSSSGQAVNNYTGTLKDDEITWSDDNTTDTVELVNENQLNVPKGDGTTVVFTRQKS